VEIDAMNRMKYDAGTLGNHEFDNGIDTLAVILKNLQFPEVSSNYKFDKTPLAGMIKPYTILTKNGLKIGIMGLNVNPKSLIFEKNYKGMEYENPIEINSLGIAVNTIQYFSTDKTGNIESINTLDIPTRGENPSVQNYGHGGGNILILNPKQTDVKTEEISNISENTRSFLDKNIPEKEKNTISKETIKLEKDKTKAENSTQTATVLNSNIKFNKIWFLIIGIGFIFGILAKKYLKS